MTSDIRTFEGIDLLEFQQSGHILYLAVCTTGALDNGRGTYERGPQLLRRVLSIDGVTQPDLWGFSPQRLISSDIVIARTSDDIGTLRCQRCFEKTVVLYSFTCGHHYCEQCEHDCAGGRKVNTPLQLEAEGRVYSLTPWVTWDFPDRLPLGELVRKLRVGEIR